MTAVISSRVPKLLDHIHSNLNKPLPVDELAKVTHCSRWQLQRDFTHATGLSVAQYVRRLKLARAAELLLENNNRQLDIVMSCGFDSEISFHRSFKRQYQCTPGQYRKRGVKTGIQLPLATDCLIPLRIETQSAMSLVGICCEMHGVLSNQMDASLLVPDLWQEFFHQVKKMGVNDLLSKSSGVIGAVDTQSRNGILNYWAGIPSDHAFYHQLESKGFKTVDIPEQTYLVITYQQDEDCRLVEPLTAYVEWALNEWFPSSPYQPFFGFDLETFPQEGLIEYWIPINT